jgi:hypothetical protein
MKRVNASTDDHKMESSDVGDTYDDNLSARDRQRLSKA